MKHHCHALGCKTPCAPKMLMCRGCWSKVPRAIQDDVYRTVKLRGPQCDKTWAPWWRAQAQATHHVAMLKDPSPKGQAWLMRELAFADRLENGT